MRIAIVAVEGSLMSAITGLADLFWMSNQALLSPPSGFVPEARKEISPVFETVIVSADGKALRDPQGRLIPVDAAFDDVGPCDAALVTGYWYGARARSSTTDSRVRKASRALAQRKSSTGRIGGCGLRGHVCVRRSRPFGSSALHHNLVAPSRLQTAIPQGVSCMGLRVGVPGSSCDYWRALVLG